MSDGVEGRLGRIEQALEDFKEDRVHAREDRRELISEIKNLRTEVTHDINGLKQTLQSTQAVISTISLEKCGERLREHDGLLEDHSDRLKSLENRTQNLPLIETDVMFWRRVLGGGFRFIFRIGAVVLGSAATGSALTKLFWSH